MNHGGTEDTEGARRKLVVNSTPTKSWQFSVAVSVSSVSPWCSGEGYLRTPNRPSRKNSMSCRPRSSCTRSAITSPITLQNL
jgi:hypothetical protein